MATEGFHLVGLLRFLQGEIMALVGFVAVLLILAAIVRRVIGGSDMRSEDAASIHTATRWGIRLLILASLALFAWRVVSVMSVNRLPRSDVDKSDVYKQMEDYKEKPAEDLQTKERK